MKRKVLFVVPSLLGGGAERVVLTLIKHLDRDKFIPILVVLKKEGRFIKEVPSDVEFIDLNVSRARYAIFNIIKTIRKLKPDVVFSTLGHLNLLMALIRPFFSKKIRFISRESNTVSSENKQERYPKLFDLLYKYIYNNFDSIITQSKYMRDDLVNNYATNQDKISVIYNPVDIQHVTKLANEKDEFKFLKNRINLLAVGRLTYQKGFDMLIESMSYLDDKFYLTILGEGDYEEYKNLMDKYDVADKVLLAGFCNNPYKYMKSCDLFILSSRYEGLPNVVLEANACGSACVAVDNPGGTAEIIEDRKTGILVSKFDPKLLALSIKEAISINFDKEYIKQHCEKNHSVVKIVKEYEELLS
jgi:glycosyltransferase involved in cell wall biosynthesis